MHQQLARPFRGMIEAVGLQIFRNIGVDQPDFAAAGVGVGFGDGGLALPQRFHLGAGERKSRLEGLVDKIVEACFAIVRDHAKLSLCWGRLLSRHGT